MVGPTEVPDGSIYFWMYNMGLRHVPFDEVVDAVAATGKMIRKKDAENYWNGWYRSSLYATGDDGSDVWTLRRMSRAPEKTFFETAYGDYEDSPFTGMPEVANRFVPCSAENKPLFAWKDRCLSLADAKAMRRCVYLAENLKGTNIVVFDCDGDHDPSALDIDSIAFFSRFRERTHCLSKPKAICEYEGYERTGMQGPASFHLTFFTEKVVPTRHFLKAHVDLLGNMKNQLRYFKNKQWNGMQPAPMTPEIWEEIKGYLRRREA